MFLLYHAICQEGKPNDRSMKEDNTMKKYFALLIAVIMIISTTAAFAEGNPPSGGTPPTGEMGTPPDGMPPDGCGGGGTPPSGEMGTPTDGTPPDGFGGGQGGGFGGFDMEGMQKRMKAQTDFLKSVLTKEQFAAYEEDQRKMMEQFGGGGFGF